MRSPPPIEDVIEMDALQGTPAGFREALQAIDEVNLDMVFRRRANVITVSNSHFERALSQCNEGVVGGDRGRP